ncbi:MAG TPA: glycosyltransferase family 39 protein, partial [Xanthobacteraceae bacterium]
MRAAFNTWIAQTPLVRLAERLAAPLLDPARRDRAVVGLLAAYVAVWTVYELIAHANHDLHFDMSEAVVWSQHPALGYPKHPPMLAWTTGLWFAVFPRADWAFYLLAMLSAAVALLFIWRATEGRLSDEKRVAALALATFIPFYNFLAFKYNANMVLIPFWAATGYFFLRSYETRGVGYAALAGAAAAGAMLGKYWSVSLLAGLVIAALLAPQRKAYFRSAAP